MSDVPWWPLNWLNLHTPMAIVHLPNGESWSVHDWRKTSRSPGYFIQKSTLLSPEDNEPTFRERRARVVPSHLCEDLFEVKAFLLLRITGAADE